MQRPHPTEMLALVATAGFSAIATLGLYFAIKRASTAKLRSVVPWVNGALWTIWLAVFVAIARQTVTDKRSFLGILVWILYFPALAASGWIRSRLEFADPSNWNTKRMARLLQIPGRTYVGIKNPAGAAQWYVEKLGLRRLALRHDSDPQIIRMRFSSNAEEIRLGPHDPLSLGGNVMLYSKRLRRVREVLHDSGIEVGPIQIDRQGTSYFEFHDPEGNTIEVCGARLDS